MGVEAVPPFFGGGVVAGFVEVGDGGISLALVLEEGKLFVGGVGGDVVPGIEFEDVVAFGEVAGTELEGVAALLGVGG